MINIVIHLQFIAGHDMGHDFEMLISGTKHGIAILAGTVLFAGIINGFRTIAWHRPESAACGNCGYPVHGLAEPRCPECGSDFIAAGIQSAEFPRPRHPVGWLILWVGFFIAIGGFFLAPENGWPCFVIIVPVILGFIGMGAYSIHQNHVKRLGLWRKESSKSVRH